MRLSTGQRNVLEAADTLRIAKSYEIESASGYTAGSTSRFMTELKKMALIFKAGGVYQVSEVGKIALAILRGQERRKRGGG